MYYLYNGVRLPKLPEYDTAVYPYAVLDKTNAGTSFLFYAFKSRPYYGTNPADSTRRGVYSTGGAKVYYFVPADGGNEWVHQMDTDNPFAAEDGNENTLFWTNVDILNEVDGGIWLAASVPVEDMNWLKIFQNGLVAGLCGVPLPFADCGGSPEKPDLPSRVPVAYLYNGVRLPPLPEWDETEYPHAVIEGTLDSYPLASDRYLLVSKDPLVVHKSNITSTATYLYLNGLKGAMYWLCKPSNNYTLWEYVGSYPYDARICWTGGDSEYDKHRFMWSNYDVRDTEHNSVFCGKSDPFPLYE